MKRRRRIALVFLAQETTVVAAFGTENETLATAKPFTSECLTHGRLSFRVCIGLENMALLLA
jgi:hypothetical protein